MHPDDLVVDIGAAVGDFAVFASRKARKVIAIEPSQESYRIMSRNLNSNNCHNVSTFNIGVTSGQQKTETLTFGGTTFSFETERLGNIVDEKIDFLKLDIEGYETEVLRDNLDTVKNCRVVAIELHGTKQDIDSLLLPLGFRFIPVTKGYIYCRLLRHPIAALRAYLLLRTLGKVKLAKMLSRQGPDIANTASELIVGCYVRTDNLVAMNHERLLPTAQERLGALRSAVCN
jgi:FkbM family methyltransferase